MSVLIARFGVTTSKFLLVLSGHLDLRPPSLRITSATSTSSKPLRLLPQCRCGRPFPSVNFCRAARQFLHDKSSHSAFKFPNFSYYRSSGLLILLRRAPWFFLRSWRFLATPSTDRFAVSIHRCHCLPIACESKKYVGHTTRTIRGESKKYVGHTTRTIQGFSFRSATSSSPFLFAAFRAASQLSFVHLLYCIWRCISDSQFSFVCNTSYRKEPAWARAKAPPPCCGDSARASGRNGLGHSPGETMVAYEVRSASAARLAPA